MEDIIKVLDLFCGEGGAAVGYHRAFSEYYQEVKIMGIDIVNKVGYPYTLMVGDVIRFLDVEFLRGFDFIHASCPCQRYSRSVRDRLSRPDLIDPVRSAMVKSGVPGVLENVPEAPLRNDCTLVGYQFGLDVVRARRFEFVNWFTLVTQVPPTNKTVHGGDFVTVAGKGNLKATGGKPYKGKTSGVLQAWRDAMGCHWMTNVKSLAESIPPAYTEYIGKLWISQKKAGNP